MVICYTAITMNIFIIFFVERYIAQCIASGWSPRCFIKRDPEIQWIRKYQHLFPHTWRSWKGQCSPGWLSSHIIYSGTHVFPFCYPATTLVPKRVLISAAWSKMGPQQTGRSERGQVQNTSFTQVEWCRSRTQHFHSHSILENWVLWPQTHNPHTHKFGLLGLKGEREMQSWGGKGTCSGEENGSVLTTSSLYHKSYKIIVIPVLYHQITLQPCFPVELFIFDHFGEGHIDCSSDNSQFCLLSHSFMRQCWPLPGRAVTLTSTELLTANYCNS